jgi:hypothetical protein
MTDRRDADRDGRASDTTLSAAFLGGSMKSVFFGLGLQYDSGSQPSVSMNADGVIVEVHKSQTGSGLWYHVGAPDKATVNWGPSVQYDNGDTPSCAINIHNTVVEVHKSQTGSGLWYHVGTVQGNSISWGPSQEYDSGQGPRVAMNDQGVVIEVHQSQSKYGLWYHIGTVSGNTVNWGDSHQYDEGTSPSVAVNNQGVVIEVHRSQTGSDLWYHVGRVNGAMIAWGPSVHYDQGEDPAVAITDDGMVIEVHQSQANNGLWQRVGYVNGTSIDWIGAAQNYDDGNLATVSLGGKLAIQVHQSESFGTLWFSTSLITDRAGWMENNLAVLQSKGLGELTLPASHDSGMYLGGFDLLGKTQDLDIYGQLAYGIRYFDLRPGWDGSDFYIYHSFIKGPKLSDVLSGVQQFMAEGHRELAILKLSHYSDFTDDIYNAMVAMIRSYLGKWLYTSLPEGMRLADVQLGSYIGASGVVLPVCDGDYPVNNPASGIWVYRDWDSATAAEGDLRVFDQYSNTMSYDTMKSDQLQKYYSYNGMCKDDQSLPCDLFLLSWTLTPPTAVWPTSKTANSNLGAVIADLQVPNQYGCIPNLLYVDYVEYARVTDVSMFQDNALSADVMTEIEVADGSTTPATTEATTT